MLQVFHLNVAKIDLDVACVVMAIHACFKRIFQVFHLFQTYVVSVLFGSFKSRSRGSTCCNYVVLLLDDSPCLHGSPRRLVLRTYGRVTTPPAGAAAWVTVGHCNFQKYVAATWVIVPPAGAACMWARDHVACWCCCVGHRTACGCCVYVGV
jgi:hypothetical protein